MSGVKIKICGLMRSKDIEYVNEFMPDYIGFVFAKSKRQIDFVYPKAFKRKLDKSVKTVGRLC